MIKHDDYSLITCILPFHQSHQLLERLDAEKGIIMANKSSARGSSYTTDFKWVEMEILEVLVPKERADEIFSFLFFEGNINKEGGGMIFQHKMETVSPYQLPHLGV